MRKLFTGMIFVMCLCFTNKLLATTIHDYAATENQKIKVTTLPAEEDEGSSSSYTGLIVGGIVTVFLVPTLRQHLILEPFNQHVLPNLGYLTLFLGFAVITDLGNINSCGQGAACKCSKIKAAAQTIGLVN